MTSTTTARALKASGLVWSPTKGDRFVIPDRDMDGDVFVVSDMTVEAQDLATGQVLGFNGTTEWALDSVDADDVLWLPREGQLRAELGGAFTALQPARGLWAVTTRRADGTVAATLSPHAEEAYALALLALRAGSAAQLLPVAAGGLAALLHPLGADAWQRPAPDGVRTVADVVVGAVGGLGAEPATGWPAALGALLQAWVAPADRQDGRAAQVAEAGAQGVLVDLAAATWDVAAATWDVAAAAGLPAPRERLDPAVVSRALAHVRTWPTSADPVAPRGAGDDLDELLLLTGRPGAG